MIVRTLAALAPGLGGVLLLCTPLYAQDPPRRPPRDPAPPDTAVADSVVLRADSAALARDSVRPLPRFSEIFGPEPVDVGFVRFTWDREALLREGAVTVADVLERVPGITGVRGGLYLQPEAVTAFGQTRGRVEVILDGYVLDPLVGSTLDLAHIEVTQLTGMHVERRLDVTRIHLSSAEATESRPYSRIEAATGEPDGSVFRGLFIAPHVIVGPLALAIDRIDSDGPNRAQPADVLALWGKWSWLAADSTRGLQVEYRQSRLRRGSGVPWIADRDRRDIVVRARQRFAPGFGAELFAGHGSMRETAADAVDTTGTGGSTDGDELTGLERSHLQAGVRASFRHATTWIDADLRLRDSWALPNRQLDVHAGFRPLAQLALAGNLTSAAWRGPESALSWDVRAELRPVGALALFAETAGGERGAPLYADSGGRTTVQWPVLDSRTSHRFGASLRAFGVDAVVAAVRVDADDVAPFGLPFDSVLAPQPVEAATGYEAFGRVTLWPAVLAAYGSFNSWPEAPGWLYLPTRSWRAGLEVHTLPLPSGNLEILARVESQRRGPMLVPDLVPPAEGAGPGAVSLPAQHMIHAYLQIRIIDVRAFIQWSDMMAVRREDLPGRVINGRRILYGVKWQLFD